MPGDRPKAPEPVAATGPAVDPGPIGGGEQRFHFRFGDLGESQLGQERVEFLTLFDHFRGLAGAQEKDLSQSVPDPTGTG